MIPAQIERLKRDINELSYIERRYMKRGLDTKAQQIRIKREFMISDLKEITHYLFTWS